jgi:hypothetical protein
MQVTATMIGTAGDCTFLERPGGELPPGEQAVVHLRRPGEHDPPGESGPTCLRAADPRRLAGHQRGPPGGADRNLAPDGAHRALGAPEV